MHSTCSYLRWVVLIVWNLRTETEAGSERGRRQEVGRGGEKEVKRKPCALSHTAVEAEPLARILLVLSAIWNVESLPLSVTVLERGCPRACVPPPSSFPAPWRRPRQWGRGATDSEAGKQDLGRWPHLTGCARRGICGPEDAETTEAISWTLQTVFLFPYKAMCWEIIWISLVGRARLSGFGADWFPSGVFLPLLCVGVLAPCEVFRFVCFAIPGSSLPVCMQS